MSGGPLLHRLLLPPSALFIFRATDGSVQAAAGRALLALKPAQALQYGLAFELVPRMPAVAEPKAAVLQFEDCAGSAFQMLDALPPAPSPPPLKLADVLEDSGGGLLTRQVQQWYCPTEGGRMLLIRSLA